MTPSADVLRARLLDVAHKLETTVLAEVTHAELLAVLREAAAGLFAAKAEGPDWQPIETAPRANERHILLWTTDHGVTEAWFSAGYWSEETPDHPREYSGSAWVCGDDAWQIEVEEFKNEAGHLEYHDGTATHWKPLPAPPVASEETRRG